jgi:hypothetical protein
LPGRRPDMINFPQRNWTDYGGEVTGPHTLTEVNTFSCVVQDNYLGQFLYLLL